ncbi:hypothetical protein [Natrinema limicola]|uniref:Uncharacterized protein n=1 Tax=Natrinema limicola JCM 13563 TaxID=1230457 RepID=M0C3X3_9EURY|nr:hypothetical protein [Natrinema limicola]ELZ17002.1 hypothetical protein C476_16770 [Natrinema limicola JCM 13563]
MTADERVAMYFIEDQLADLTDAIREPVQNGTDSLGSSCLLDSVSPERSLILDDGAGVEFDHYEDEVSDPDSYRWRRSVRERRKRFAYV